MTFKPKPHALYSLRPSGSGRQGCGFNPWLEYRINVG